MLRVTSRYVPMNERFFISIPPPWWQVGRRFLPLCFGGPIVLYSSQPISDAHDRGRWQPYQSEEMKMTAGIEIAFRWIVMIVLLFAGSAGAQTTIYDNLGRVTSDWTKPNGAIADLPNNSSPAMRQSLKALP